MSCHVTSCILLDPRVFEQSQETLKGVSCYCSLNLVSTEKLLETGVSSSIRS